MVMTITMTTLLFSSHCRPSEGEAEQGQGQGAGESESKARQVTIATSASLSCCRPGKSKARVRWNNDHCHHITGQARVGCA